MQELNLNEIDEVAGGCRCFCYSLMTGAFEASSLAQCKQICRQLLGDDSKAFCR